MTKGLPGPKGLANIRWSLRLASDIYGVLPELHREFGDVFELGFGRFRAVYVVGPEASQTLFAQGPATVSWHDAMAPLIPVDGETAIVVSDGADHERRRRIVQPAFARRKLDDTVTLMQAEAKTTFASWIPGTTHEAYAELRACVGRIVVRALFGDDLGAKAEQVQHDLGDAMAYINRPPWTRFDHDWPGTPYRKAMRSRQAVDRVVFDEIARRRQLDDINDRVDLLSSLLVAQDVDGALSDVEVRDQVISLIAAGYDTTTAAASWMVHFLATNPDVVKRATAEIDAVIGMDAVTAEHLQRMPWLNGIVSETLRIGSPAYVAGRRIEAPFDVLGHTLPAGPFVFYNPYITHRLEHLWPDAEAFRPGRWIEGHAHHQEIVAGSWIPFGGGARRCLGFGFAITELKVLAVELIRQVGDHLKPERSMIPPTGLASMAPKDGVTVSIA
jgi:cytochrome P450